MKKLSTIQKRILTASVLIAVIWSLSYMGGLYFLGLMCIISLLCGKDLYRMLSKKGIKTDKRVLFAATILAVAGAYMGSAYLLVSFLAVGVGMLAVNLWNQRENMAGYIENSALSFLFTGLLGSMAGSAVLVRNTEAEIPGGIWSEVFAGMEDPGFFFVAMAFICVAVSDSVAYFAGKWIGSRKLAPGISPGKTVEGGIAGILAAAGAGVAVNAAFANPLPSILASASLGLFIGIAGITGDLIESALKRDCGEKDSGSMLPGHGGFLDRFDGMLVVFPALYILTVLF